MLKKAAYQAGSKVEPAFYISWYSLNPDSALCKSRFLTMIGRLCHPEFISGSRGDSELYLDAETLQRLADKFSMTLISAYSLLVIYKKYRK